MHTLLTVLTEQQTMLTAVAVSNSTCARKRSMVTTAVGRCSLSIANGSPLPQCAYMPMVGIHWVNAIDLS